MPGFAYAPATGCAASVPLPDAISRLLARPDLRIAPHERSLSFEASLALPFTVSGTGHVTLGPPLLNTAAARLRHALELALLLPRLRAHATLAGLAAGRVAALYAVAHSAPSEPWHAALALPQPPRPRALAKLWPILSRLQPDHPSPDAALSAAEYDLLADIWPLLGSAEVLMQRGGDQRLQVDPKTGLNFYGCSHRPRPWAITFASSTASSSSERGFAAAEAARQRICLAALTGQANAALGELAMQTRRDIAARAGVPEGGDVILAASGTDCELLTLALITDGRPVTNILIAPEETGSGVPLAATGCHFGADTARGVAVAKAQLVNGFASGTVLAPVPARTETGTMREPSAIATSSAALAEQAAAAGRLVLLHLLDISKTGYIAPCIDDVTAIAAAHPHSVRVVVDACQGRLTRDRIADYLARGWFVQITGSKFLTGPPFAGAILVPPAHAARLETTLPAGLADYSSRPEWPPGLAGTALPARANDGLLLRWQAALAEWAAFDLVPPERQRAIITRFTQRVRQGIADNPDLSLFDAAPPARPDGGWDGLQTIIGFVIRPASPLDPVQARCVYRWLNADLRAHLPDRLSAEHERLACLRCHIGQPVPLPMPDSRTAGVLRISAGARLVSGEPSHHDLDEDARLLREIRDALAVLAKISLILAHWDRLQAADPQPSF